VRIRTAQRERRPGGLIRVLTDSTWTGWLPIYAWVVDHPEGIVVVDAGETARTAEPGYFPRWHPYYRRAVEMDVRPEDEIGPQLAALGIRPEDVRTLVLTHFHTDHAGGLRHFPRSRVLVSGDDFATARSVVGRLQGYLPQHWPSWFDPTPIPFAPQPVGPLERSFSLTAAGDVRIVPTPGHTPAHVSVVVRAGGVAWFLAGDTSYTETLMLRGRPDGVSPRASVTVRTLRTIAGLARREPTVYLPTHDPESERRLAECRVLDARRLADAA
jgi:glyoxylase-like metal-dependent hydrolase (beta-lactamase superfamily II)